jgi:signal peptidase I
VKRGDAVVFNFPAGDTVIHADGFESAVPYYEIKRKDQAGSKFIIMQGQINASRTGRDTGLIKKFFQCCSYRRIKTDNFIKRCVAIAGDTIKVD